MSTSEPHQPQSFSFPKRQFRKAKRSCQASWFKRWPWLHYLEDQDDILCFICVRASSEKKLNWSNNAEAAFISEGFSNWKKNTIKFSSHEGSRCHKEAVLKLISLPSTMKDIGESLSQQHMKEKMERRQWFLKILSNSRFLARQGLAFRGCQGDESNSNFIKLLKLRGEDDRRILDWIKRKIDKYTAPDVQHEILEVMSHSVLRQISSTLRSAKFLAVMIDETTDK